MLHPKGLLPVKNHRGENNMLKIHMPLLPSEKTSGVTPPEILPTATAEIAVRGNRGRIRIALAGVIASESVPVLLQFLRDVSCFRATRWSIQMKDLSVISSRGLRVLLKFAHILRQRGFGLQVVGVHPHVLMTMRELDMMNAFVWPD